MDKRSRRLRSKTYDELRQDHWTEASAKLAEGLGYGGGLLLRFDASPLDRSARYQRETKQVPKLAGVLIVLKKTDEMVFFRTPTTTELDRICKAYLRETEFHSQRNQHGWVPFD